MGPTDHEQRRSGPGPGHRRSTVLCPEYTDDNGDDNDDESVTVVMMRCLYRLHLSADKSGRKIGINCCRIFYGPVSGLVKALVFFTNIFLGL